jgi:DNA repair protein RadA/Sms
MIAGPKVLEHVVDVVLQMEGETGTPLRLLRGVKNRYGATDELGVFEMTEKGLAGVTEPSAMFLSQRQPGASGSAVATVIEGTRPLTVEVQALVTSTQSTSPRRTAAGYDPGRLHLLVAVISKRLKMPLGSQDVVVNIAGGLRISEPAADLAVALAIISSFMDIPLKEGLSASGEIGLGGELRAVHQAARRAGEASRLGFEQCLLPSGSSDMGDAEASVVRAATLGDAVRIALPAVNASSGGSANSG